MYKFMELAIEEAKKSGDDIPVGAVLVKDGKVIVKAFNKKECDNDVTSHAEILVLREGGKQMNNWRLDECDLYVTLEPCPMCGWAILQARVKNLYYGSYDSRYGAFTSEIDLQKLAGSKIKIYGGIMEKECNTLLENYFKKIR